MTLFLTFHSNATAFYFLVVKCSFLVGFHTAYCLCVILHNSMFHTELSYSLAIAVGKTDLFNSFHGKGN